MEKLIKLIEEKLTDQEETISIKEWEIANLKGKLEEAEAEIERMKTREAATTEAGGR